MFGYLCYELYLPTYVPYAAYLLSWYKYKWYVVYYVNVQGAYKSWEDCITQLMGYKHNLHKGYKTIEEAEKVYSKFLALQSSNYVALKGATRCGGSRLMDFIIGGLVRMVYLMLS
jgi:hypothetical protein